MWIDTHCHLNIPKINSCGNIRDIIRTAKEGGVDKAVTICCRISEEYEELLAIANSHQDIFCTIGTHPHDSALAAEKAYSAEKIAQIAQSHEKIIAIGETGLDYYYDNSPRADQKESFIKHIKACLISGLPIVIHTRDAETDTADIMKKEGEGGKLKGVMHCYSSSRELAVKALDMGFYISFSGIITFKKSNELREVAKIVPLDRVLIETDAPFLAPEPYRGKVNQPAYVANVGKFLANLYGINADDFAKITTENFYSLFDKVKRN